MGNGPALDYETLITWAAGVAAAQAECSLDDALLLMQERAAITDRTMEEIAVAVLDHLVQFRG